MGKVIADLATSAASATFAVENATSSVDYVLSGTDGSANHHLKTDGSGNLAWVAPPTAGVNTPYFYAYLVTDASISDATWTKVPCNTVSFETGATYDETTNFRFTPAVAGKYYIYGQVQCRSDTTAKLSETRISIYKNGSDAFHTVTMNRDRDGLTYNTPTIAGVLDMNTTDYVELWAYIDAYSGGQRFYGSYQATHFMAYKLID